MGFWILTEHRAADELRIVAIGGGTGLSNLLRVLKGLGCAPTAVVAMTDNGGSSGKLRADFGMLPPGDVRSCLVALSCSEPDMERLLCYRFPDDSTLSGHNVGNILLAAIMQAEELDFAAATERLSALLAIRGRVLPSTTADVALGALLEDGTCLQGESQIAADERQIKEVFLLPRDGREKPQACPDVLQAIAEAEYIFIGPGSMYSSLVANLLVPGVAAAIKQSPAKVYYIANMATEPGEMPAVDLSCSVGVLEHYYQRAAQNSCGHLLDKVIANVGEYGAPLLAELAKGGSAPLQCDQAKLAAFGVALLEGDFVDIQNVWQHNQAKLAAMLKAELQL